MNNANDFALRRAWRSLPSTAVNIQKITSLLLLSILVAAAQPAVNPAPPPPASVFVTNVAEPDPQMLRSLLILQEQVRATERAVDQARQEAQAEARRTAEAMAARMNSIEQSLNSQREREMKDLQRSTHRMLIIVGVATALGFIAVMIAGFMQVRAATRLVEASRQLALMPAPRYQELPESTTAPAPLPGPSVETAGANLLGAIDRLEHRLEEMETTEGGTQTATYGHKSSAAAPSPSQVATVLSKGQALLNMDKADEALEQFDEALRIDARNIEAWIKRGTALERLQRVDDAVAAYDQAIAIDGAAATAYLFKAGVYNRQKKYAEALQCYEKALNAQQRSRAAAQST